MLDERVSLFGEDIPTQYVLCLEILTSSWTALRSCFIEHPLEILMGFWKFNSDFLNIYFMLWKKVQGYPTKCDESHRTLVELTLAKCWRMTLYQTGWLRRILQLGEHFFSWLIETLPSDKFSTNKIVFSHSVHWEKEGMKDSRNCAVTRRFQRIYSFLVYGSLHTVCLYDFAHTSASSDTISYKCKIATLRIVWNKLLRITFGSPWLGNESNKIRLRNLIISPTHAICMDIDEIDEKRWVTHVSCCSVKVVEWSCFVFEVISYIYDARKYYLWFFSQEEISEWTDNR